MIIKKPAYMLTTSENLKDYNNDAKQICSVLTDYGVSKMISCTIM